jgi:Holliday junction resolvase-like predicted endonuclease
VLGDLLLIGRQVRTEYGLIDLLALDRDGTVVIIELKRGVLRRDIVAQVNDYLTCVKRWNAYELEAKANLVPQTRAEERVLVSCVFRRKSDIDSDSSRTPVLIQVGRRFR